MTSSTQVRAPRQAPANATMRDKLRDPAWQAFTLLRTVLGVAFLATGIDKFFNLLAYWPAYLAPVAYGDAPLGGQPFMYMVGVMEIGIGIAVLVVPRYGSLLFAGWLLLIIANLLLVGGFNDIAVRDFGLAVAALALFRLTFHRTPIASHRKQEYSHA
ncbi:MAG: DoxX family protein [Terrimesophilobacter sp.]